MDEGPPKQADELRRHVYLSDELRSGSKSNTTPVVSPIGIASSAHGAPIGWQAKKPDDYTCHPVSKCSNQSFRSRARRRRNFLARRREGRRYPQPPEHSGIHIGGVGDGLPEGIGEFLRGRHLVILADNDDAGHAHAEKKATLAQAAGAASIKVVHFSELPLKGDISDFVANGGPAEQLLERVDGRPAWEPLHGTRSETAAPSKDETAALISRCAADIAPEKIEWLWAGRLARGKAHLRCRRALDRQEPIDNCDYRGNNDRQRLALRRGGCATRKRHYPQCRGWYGRHDHSSVDCGRGGSKSRACRVSSS